jgi:3-hydroxyacyl-[acyl-carrier-protein] dehydratase
MRWYWIDRFTEFESGQYAVAVKNVSLAEEHLHDHYPHAPVMPNSLVIEGIAQTGGLLVAEHGNWEERVVLGKIAKARFDYHAVPGDSLVYRTTILNISKDGAIVRGTSHVGDRLQAELELYFVHIDEGFAGKSLFEPAGFLSLLRVLGVFSVGRAADGSRLQVPEHLARAERDLEVDEIAD